MHIERTGRHEETIQRKSSGRHGKRSTGDSEVSNAYSTLLTGQGTTREKKGRGRRWALTG